MNEDAVAIIPKKLTMEQWDTLRAITAGREAYCTHAKNQRGAEAFTALISVIQTATQAGALSTTAYVRNLFSTPTSPSGQFCRVAFPEAWAPAN